MSLATRCPACGTVFRLVPDQLKVSDGWVRCGRCTEVFNASQRLFELEAQAPGSEPGAPPPTQAPAPSLPATPPEPQPPAPQPPQPLTARADPEMEGTPAPPAADEAVLSVPAMPGAVDAGAASAESAESAETAAPAAPAAADAPPSPAADGRPKPPYQSPPAPDAAPAPAPAPEPKLEPAAGPAAPAASEPLAGPAPEPAPETQAAEPVPGFLRRAEQAARWQQPRRVALLAGVSLLLALLLAAQVALHYRDHLAATVPASRTALAQACSWLGCTIEPPRHIDSLHVDSSGLVRVPDSALYRLTLVVQNKAAFEVRMPAVELVLSDAQGQTVVRRVFTAGELGQPAPSLPPRGEAALQALLDLGERHMAGYTVELFYP